MLRGLPVDFAKIDYRYIAPRHSYPTRLTFCSSIPLCHRFFSPSRRAPRTFHAPLEPELLAFSYLILSPPFNNGRCVRTCIYTRPGGLPSPSVSRTSGISFAAVVARASTGCTVDGWMCTRPGAFHAAESTQKFTADGVAHSSIPALRSNDEAATAARPIFSSLSFPLLLPCSALPLFVLLISLFSLGLAPVF